MREIKFRAWDKEKKTIFSWSFTEQGLYPQDFFNNDNYQIMQYTGLHDKNGKEIYEGDVLSMHNGQYKSQVMWESPEFYAYHHGGSEALTTFLEVHEVIGNVWENPELLSN